MTDKTLTVEQVELKPCPFCGGEAAGEPMPSHGDVGCTNQQCPGYLVIAQPEAWNRRSALSREPDKQLAERVREACAGVCEALVQEINCRADRWAHETCNAVRRECAEEIRAIDLTTIIAVPEGMKALDRCAEQEPTMLTTFGHAAPIAVPQADKELRAAKCGSADASNRSQLEPVGAAPSPAATGLPEEPSRKVDVHVDPSTGRRWVTDAEFSAWFDYAVALRAAFAAMQEKAQQGIAMQNMIGLCGEDEVRDIAFDYPLVKLRALIDALITQRNRATEAERQVALLARAVVDANKCIKSSWYREQHAEAIAIADKESK